MLTYSLLTFYLGLVLFVVLSGREFDSLLVSRLVHLLSIGLIIATKGYLTIFARSNFHFLLLLSPFIAHFIFFISILLTQLSFRESLLGTLPIKSISRFYVQHPRLVFHYIQVAFFEELLWRASIQQFLGNSWWAILIIAILFTLIHFHKMQALPELIEFFLFSLFLGCWFSTFRNFWSLLLLHAMRDIHLRHYYYCLKQRRIAACKKQRVKTLHPEIKCEESNR